MHERVVYVRECVCMWFDDTEPNANHNIVLGVRVLLYTRCRYTAPFMY